MRALHTFLLIAIVFLTQNIVSMESIEEIVLLEEKNKIEKVGLY